MTCKVEASAFLRGSKLGRPLRIAFLVAGCLAFIPVLACSWKSASPPRPPKSDLASAPGDAAVLSPGQALRGELAAAEVHRYRLALGEAQYVRLLADQRQIDVELRLLSPAEEEILRADGPGGRRIEEQISFLTEAAGEYGLEIRSVDRRNHRGSYRVEIEELRAATPGDVSRVAAEELFVEAVHWRSLNTADALRRAIRSYELARPLWRRAGDLGEEAKTVNQIGMAQQRLGAFREALASYETALELRIRAGDPVGEANTRTNIGHVYRGLGQTETALGWYEQALTLWHELGEPRRAATTLHSIGSTYLRDGEAWKALEFLERAIEVKRQSGVAIEAGILNSLGVCYRQIGDIETAIEHYRQALERSTESGDLRIEAGALSNLGQAYRLQGEAQKALAHYHRALEINRQQGSPEPIAQVLRNLGTAYVELGHMETARRYYGRALDLFSELGDQRAMVNVRRNLAWVDMTLDDAGAALRTLEPALAAARVLEDRFTEADILFAMGVAYLDAEAPRRAVEVLTRSLERWRELGRRGREADTLTHLGAAHHELADPERAGELLRQAHSLGVRLSSRTLEASSLSRLALVERDLGRLEQARALLAEALAITERQRRRIPTPELRATFLARRRDYYDDYTDLLLRLSELRHGPGERAGDMTAMALEASERARARGLLDLLFERRHDVDRGLDPELAAREKSLWVKLAQVQTELIRASSSDSQSERVEDLKRRLRSLEEEQERLELEIRERHPRYAELHYPEPVALEEVRQRLDPATALLEYVVGKTGALLFVMTKDGIRSFRIPASAEEVRQLVDQVRTGLTRPGRRHFGGYRLAAHRLFELLIAPALGHLEDQQRHLLIVPDRSLHYLPFEALLTRSERSPGSPSFGDLSFLIRRFSVSYVPSASVLQSLARRSAARDGQDAPALDFLAFADPLYRPAEPESKLPSAFPAPRAAGSSGTEWALGRLEHSGREVREIARLYPADRSALYLRADASEENVKRSSELTSTRYLHFATHGLLDEGRPQSYGLVLALDEDPGEDGLLQVYEIFHLELRAELVVLSACETGLGREVTGEGLVGLSRAFLYAGATRVAVSLWPVADRSTADLMVRFYRGLGPDRSTAEALRRAKLEMIEEGRFAHPFHWAPFVLIGEP